MRWQRLRANGWPVRMHAIASDDRWNDAESSMNQKKARLGVDGLLKRRCYSGQPARTEWALTE
jgi:hypothetical protein